MDGVTSSENTIRYLYATATTRVEVVRYMVGMVVGTVEVGTVVVEVGTVVVDAVAGRGLASPATRKSGKILSS